VLERIVENWLSRVNERSFMLPFSQLLITKGYQLFYVSHHTMLEAGKDLIATKGKKVVCYQLKQGNVTLPKFTAILGELQELVAHPIQHPSLSNKTKYSSYLVATGEIGDPVRTRIVEKNAMNWGESKSTKLEYIDIGLLLPDFIKYYGTYFPSEPKSFKQLLELYLTDGSDQFPKENYSQFLSEYFELYTDKQLSKNVVSALIAASVIMTSYILTPWVEKKNYIAQIEALVCLLAAILALSEKYSLNDTSWRMSYNLVNSEIDKIFHELLEELRQRKHLIEGDWICDSAVYRARIPIVLGFITGYALGQRVNNHPLSEDEELFIEQQCYMYLKNMKFIGESYCPLFINIALFLENRGNNSGFSLLKVVMIGLIEKRYIPQPFGWPNPYYDYEQSLEIMLSLTEPKEHFSGQSYYLESIILLFARRNAEQLISSAWRQVTHIQYELFEPDSKWEYLIWHSKNGTKKSRFPTQTQSWTELKTESRSLDFPKLPKSILKNPGFCVLFSIVFPHRINENIFRFIDSKVNPTLFN